MPTGAKTDLRNLDDPAFLAERRRLRDRFEHPPRDVDRAELAAEYTAVMAELIRRVRHVWTAAS